VAGAVFKHCHVSKIPAEAAVRYARAFGIDPVYLAVSKNNFFYQ
jgi:hypothetical protein